MTHETVKNYYGKTLKSSADLKTNACCAPKALPANVAEALKNIHEEVKARYYGCGLVVPEGDLEGLHIVDLGSGAGRDAYVFAQLAGETGLVTGVDMTPEQLAVARAHEDWHRERFGYARSNVRFVEGYIDRLDEAEIGSAFADLAVSNCVINLVTDKSAVFRGAFQMLKPKGRMVFADVFVDVPLPTHLAEDPVIRGECLGGAMTWDDFCRLAEEAGFETPVIIEDRALVIDSPAVRDQLNGFNFRSTTVSLRKPPV